jgi:putative transposase
MNRSAKQLALFDAPADYDLFLQVLVEAERACPIRLLEYCVMPNHWHLLVWPERDDQIVRYMRWITGVHGQRWRRAKGLVGKGAVYQGRYRWVVVQDGDHFDVARRYVHQNPVRAHLVEYCDEWPWSSASPTGRHARPALARSPVEAPPPNTRTAPMLPEATVRQMQSSLRANQPFGDPAWRLELEARTWLAAVLEAERKPLRASTVRKPK